MKKRCVTQKRNRKVLRKALEKVERQVAAANDAQKAEYEAAKLSDLLENSVLLKKEPACALSMAQQTRCGHVYVLRNLGSFGEEVFTSVDDLAGWIQKTESASWVMQAFPFEFDIHARSSVKMRRR